MCECACSHDHTWAAPTWMDDIDLQRLDPPRDVKILRDKYSVRGRRARGHVSEGDKGKWRAICKMKGCHTRFDVWWRWVSDDQYQHLNSIFLCHMHSKWRHIDFLWEFSICVWVEICFGAVFRPSWDHHTPNKTETCLSNRNSILVTLDNPKLTTN